MRPWIRIVRFVTLFVFIPLLVGAAIQSLTAPALAQSTGQVSTGQVNGDIPNTAVGALGILLAWLSAVFGVGTLTNVLVEAIKKINLPFLNDEGQSRLGGLLAEAAVLLIASGLAWLAQAYLYPLAAYLDAIGVWPIVAAAVPFARWLYWQQKRAQLAGNVVVVEQ
jgi:hypothetical protein